eukprot:8096395-Alexandrium_andersonii.AAC.1
MRGGLPKLNRATLSRTSYPSPGRPTSCPATTIRRCPTNCVTTTSRRASGSHPTKSAATGSPSPSDPGA